MWTVLLLSALAAVGSAIPTIQVKGSKFFTSDGDQWFIKGIAYQLVPADPLVDGNQCATDAALMKTLGANAIRVYHVDASANHKPCMDAFANAGIYAFIDLDTFDTQINQDKPEWNATQLSAFKKVMDAFHTYDNVAGFFIGNEVLTTGTGSKAAPFVKAAARDLKAYRDTQKYRQIPVGYSAADIATLRPMLQNYLACGPNPGETIDFFALNAYEWCGESSYAQSGYTALTNDVKSYNIPIFFSETGCNTVPPRTFGDQAAIFGPDMAPYWSGSIIYEWIQESNAYGIISYGAHVDPSAPGAPPDGWPRSGTPVPVQPDFDNLKSQWQKAVPSGIKAASYTPSLTAPKCPDATPGTWEVDPTLALPLVGQGITGAKISASPSGGASATPTAKSSARSSISSTTTAVTAMATAGAVIVALSFRMRGMMVVMFCALIVVGQVVLN